MTGRWRADGICADSGEGSILREPDNLSTRTPPQPAMFARSRARTLFFILGALPVALPAQKIDRDTELHASAGAQVIATVHAGTPVDLGPRRNGEVEATIEGYVHASAVVARRGSSPIAIKAPSGAMLRAEPDAKGHVLAELRDGMALHLVSRRGEWLRVSRTGWVAEGAIAGRVVATRPTPAPAPAPIPPPRPRAAAASSRVAAATPPPPPSPPGAPPSAPPADAAQTVAAPSRAIPGDSTFTVLRATTLASSPDGPPVATLSPSVPIRALARDGGWVHVQVDGWVRESDLAPADTSLRSRIGAADLRANPTGTRGLVVHWEVQFIALETADPLRRDFAKDEPYVLARGPGTENALLYLAIPPSLLESVRRLQPLESIVVSARVRTGRSDPAGVPILDLLSFSSKR
jgi:hypothetical protein